jgi:hypothetical protein
MHGRSKARTAVFFIAMMFKFAIDLRKDAVQGYL